MTKKPQKARQAVGVVRNDDQTGGREMLAEYCRDRGYALLNVHTDAQLEQAIVSACAKKAVLVADGLGSVARSMRDAARLGRRLHEAGADLALLDQNIDTAGKPPADAVLRVLDALADLEFHRLADILPYGYTVAKDLEHVVVDAREMDVVREIVQWNHEGKTLSAIAEQLNSRGAAPRGGGSWNEQNVKQVIDHAPTSRWEFAGDEVG